MNIFKVTLCFFLLGYSCKGQLENCNKPLNTILENIIETEGSKIIVTDFFVLDDKSYVRMYPISTYISEDLKAYSIIKDSYILYYGNNDSLANKFLCLKEDINNISLKADNNSDIDVNPFQIRYYQTLNDSVFDCFEPHKIFLNDLDNLLIEQNNLKLPPPPPMLEKGIYPFQVSWNLDNIPYFQEGEKNLYAYLMKELNKDIKIDNEIITLKLKVSKEGNVENVYIIDFTPQYHEKLISLSFPQFMPAKIDDITVPSYVFFYLKF